jgi:NAD(P)-dependent dehydrogenase (short-subunit alcohol dehydrogenase family)
MNALAGKVLVIIGGTTGLGRSAARAFLREGAAGVVVVGRNADNCTSAVLELGDRCVGFSGDAMAPQTAVEAISLAREHFGSFHGLYHVAGGSGRKFGDGPIHEITDEGWAKTLEWNLTSVMYSARAALQAFLEAGTGGSILFTGSVLAHSPSPKFFTTHAYAAAKAGEIGLAKAIAANYATHGIRCNVLAPALVETPMSERAKANDAIQQFIKTKQPLDGGRMGQPEDLDAAAVFLLSDGAKFCTGQVLSVDGGWEVSEGQIPAE